MAFAVAMAGTKLFISCASVLSNDGGAAFEVVQVKEKLGGLRFYVEGSNDAIDAAIDAASELSVQNCEVCGNPGSLEEDATGWWKTLCASCRKTDQKRW